MVLRSTMTILFFATCFFALFILGSTVEQTIILKSSFEILFANFEKLDPKDGTTVKDKMLSTLLKAKDDEGVAANFHLLLSDLYDKGSPQLKEAVANFNNSVQEVEPDELKTLLLELQDDGDSEERKKRQEDPQKEDSSSNEETKTGQEEETQNKGASSNEGRKKRQEENAQMENASSKEESKNQQEEVPQKEAVSVSEGRKKRQEEDTGTAAPFIDFTMKDIPRVKYAKSENKINDEPYKTKDLLEIILNKNHSEEEIDRLHAEFHSDSKRFDEIRKTSGNPKSLLNIILQKNHSEELIDKLHRDFHKDDPKGVVDLSKTTCSRKHESKSDEDEIDDEDNEDLTKNENENMIMRVEPDNGFQIFKK